MSETVIQELQLGRCREENSGQVVPEGSVGRLQLLQRTVHGKLVVRWLDESGAASEEVGCVPSSAPAAARIRRLKQNPQIVMLELPPGARHFFWLQPSDGSAVVDVEAAVAAFDQHLQQPPRAPQQQQPEPPAALAPVVSAAEGTAPVDVEPDEEAVLLQQALAMSMDISSSSSSAVSPSPALRPPAHGFAALATDDDDDEAAMLAEALALSMSQQLQQQPPQAHRPKAAQPQAGGVQLAQLQGILSGMGAAFKPEPSMRLSEVLNSEALVPILREDPELARYLQEFVPPSRSSGEEVFETFTSPQWQAVLNNFQRLLATGQLGPLLNAFGVDCSDGTGPTSIEELMQSLQSLSMRR